jgi:hypothetical protein
MTYSFSKQTLEAIDTIKRMDLKIAVPQKFTHVSLNDSGITTDVSQKTIHVPSIFTSYELAIMSLRAEIADTKRAIALLLDIKRTKGYIMKDWENWHITGTHHLERYVPGTDVTLLFSDGSKTRQFKDWRGIITSIVSDMGTYKNASIEYAGTILLFEAWKDANSQIIIETLDEAMNNPLYKYWWGK